MTLLSAAVFVQTSAPLGSVEIYYLQYLWR